MSLTDETSFLCFAVPTVPVTWLCALLYDDVGRAVRSDISEGRQCCSGCPESSIHPSLLQVSLQAVAWKFPIYLNVCVTALQSSRKKQLFWIEKPWRIKACSSSNGVQLILGPIVTGIGTLPRFFVCLNFLWYCSVKLTQHWPLKCSTKKLSLVSLSFLKKKAMWLWAWLHPGNLFTVNKNCACLTPHMLYSAV